MTGDVKATIIQIISSDKTHDEILDQASEYIKSLRVLGYKKERIIAILTELRDTVPDEQEDVLLEVMDLLVGWCSPHAEIE
jgi:Holliday junction resolvasome RuvABC DNA-binding subunit